MPQDTNISLNITANGTTSVELEPGEYAIHAGGDFGGGTLSIRWNDGSNAETFPDGQLTAAGGLIVALGTQQIDFRVLTATSPDIDITGNRI